MKTIIFGGAGFIGSKIAEKLLNENSHEEVVIVDNLFRGRKDQFFNSIIQKENCTFINLDLTDQEAYSKLPSTFDRAYLLASVVGVEYTLQMPFKLIEINTNIIMNTLNWLKEASVNKVLFTSTSECYANTIDNLNGKIPTDELVALSIGDIFEPRFTYALTKMLGESSLYHFCNDKEIDFTIVRYHNVYGPRMGFKHVIPQVVTRFINGEDPFTIFGAQQTRSFNFIDDAVQGTILAMNTPNVSSEIFHIGDEKAEISIESLVKFIGSQLNFNGQYIDGPIHQGSVHRRCPNTQKAKELLNYSPQVSWQDGVKITIDWYKQYLSSKGDIYE